MTLIAILTVTVFVYSLISRRVERTVLTAPIVFTTAGILLSAIALELEGRTISPGVLLTIAEVGLVMLLFTDASRTDLRVLKSIRNLPVRLLSTGMLLTILLGALAALAVFGILSIWEAGILAAILAPTDAGLGQVIVSSTSVPMRIRQALNVEAGLNDGLSVPFLLFFMALAGGAGGQSLTRFIVEQLGYGTAIGIVVGLAGGYLLALARRKDWMTESWQQLGVVALPVLCLLASEYAGASMFIAAFVAGLAVQVGFKDAGRHSVEFTEEWGQLLNLSVFFLFGILAGQAWVRFDWRVALYAVFSLTLIRMLPVAIALMGSKLSRSTVLFMGWFGPRGLASIVLGLVYLEQELHLPGEATIRLAILATVLLSIFAHGLSAVPGMKLYAGSIASLGPGAPEYAQTAAIPAAGAASTTSQRDHSP